MIQWWLSWFQCFSPFVSNLIIMFHECGKWKINWKNKWGKEEEDRETIVKLLWSTISFAMFFKSSNLVKVAMSLFCPKKYKNTRKSFKTTKIPLKYTKDKKKKKKKSNPWHGCGLVSFFFFLLNYYYFLLRVFLCFGALRMTLQPQW